MERKHIAFSPVCLLIVSIVSIISSAGDFIIGADINPLTDAITIIYVLYCSAFAIYARRTNIIIPMILGLGTLIVAVIGLIVSTFSLNTDIIILYICVLVFLSPFQGLSARLAPNWLMIYAIIIVISLLWIIISIFNYRKNNKNINQKGVSAD